nr:MAG TPA: hypothetical protein [Bacteriophage sp.]
MKELQKPERIYIEKFDIYVKPRLSDAEIQQIANNVIKFKTWAERERTMNLMMFIYATEISDEDEINALDYDLMNECGVFNTVWSTIHNAYSILDAIEFSESTLLVLSQIAENLPEMLKPIGEVLKRHGKST